jgi:hypothetical protein
MHSPIHSALSAGLSSPSISTVTSVFILHRPGCVSENSAILNRALTRLPLRTGAMNRILSKAVVDSEFGRVGDRDDRLVLGGQERESQKAVSDRSAERRVLSLFRVDMDELTVPGHVREAVNHVLVDLEP